MGQSDPVEPGQDWKVDLFRPEDAPGVARLFLSVYGKDYPIQAYLDPQRLIEENGAHRIISSVARTPAGDIVGHCALFHSAPHKGIYESGAGVVHGRYRGGKGMFSALAAHGIETGARLFGVEAVYGESVCNHVFSQRMCHSLGWVTMAVEVDLMPAVAYVQEGSASGRVTSLLEFITLRPRRHRVYLPRVYERPLRFLYGALDDGRDLDLASGTARSESATEVETQYFDFAQVARLAFQRTGEDFASVLDRHERDLAGRGATVLQVWLNLAHPWVGEPVATLRARGYFLGGVLPRWFDTDGLLMQKMVHRPHWDDMKIHFDRAKEIVALARADWEKVMPGRSGRTWPETGP